MKKIYYFLFFFFFSSFSIFAQTCNPTSVTTNAGDPAIRVTGPPAVYVGGSVNFVGNYTATQGPMTGVVQPINGDGTLGDPPGGNHVDFFLPPTNGGNIGIFEGTMTITLPAGGGTLVCTYDAAGDLLASALPVELISFNVSERSGKSLLIWQTVSEYNNEGFEIEHSSNGRDWITVDFVEGKGTTAEKQIYSYSHRQPSLGLNYYRLKQMDFDGKFEYFDIKSVEISKDIKVRIFPNPAVNQFTLQTSIQEEVAVQIFNVNGQKVYESNQTVDDGLSIDVSSFSKGMYLLSLRNKVTHELLYQERIIKH